ncbi:MAG: hypothetical protein FWC89_04975 [Defluviitaleaceae bacterium]|nr:hypothetical protein [Defluviitaleaceae bacterium]
MTKVSNDRSKERTYGFLVRENFKTIEEVYKERESLKWILEDFVAADASYRKEKEKAFAEFMDEFIKGETSLFRRIIGVS